MANSLIQATSQQEQNNIPKRVIVQYYDDVSEQTNQNIVNYDDLTTEEKATFDAYQALCESKMA